jgi:tetratricopeptide (TPR) repeat protein
MPARASSAFNEAVRRVAAETDAYLVDAEAAMTRAAPEGLVGFGLIEDYVHPTPEGHWQVAAEMWTTLRAAGLLPESAPDFAAAAGPPLDREAALPDDPLLRSRFLYNLALVLQQLGENERSAEKYRACLQSNPSYVACEYNLAILHQNAGDLDAAISGFRRVVALQPDDPKWMFQLGYALLEQGQPKDAQSWLRRAAEAAPDKPRYWRTLGSAYALLGKSTDAERAQGHALRLESQRFDEP